MKAIYFIRLLLLTTFFVSAIIVHILNPTIPINDRMLSGYVGEPGGVVLTIGIFCLAVLELLVAFEYRKQVLSSLFFFLAGIGALIVGMFPVNLADVWGGTSGMHMIGAFMHFLFFPLALLFFKHKETPLHRYTRITGIITLTLFIPLGVLVYMREPQGIIQKITILAVIMWYYISAHLPGGDLQN